MSLHKKDGAILSHTIKGWLFLLYNTQKDLLYFFCKHPANISSTQRVMFTTQRPGLSLYIYSHTWCLFAALHRWCCRSFALHNNVRTRYDVVCCWLCALKTTHIKSTERSFGHLWVYFESIGLWSSRYGAYKNSQQKHLKNTVKQWRILKTF